MSDDNVKATAQKITPNLWFDSQAEEAVEFYVSVFPDSSVGDISRYDGAAAEVSGQAEGSAMTVPFELAGYRFVALNGGPQFKLTPAVSFFVYCDTVDEVDELFAELSDGGAILMPLQAYPFSDRYGWVQDKYGLSWQLYLGHSRGPKIAPALLFVGEQSGKAEDAIQLYTSLFEDAHIEDIARYGQGEAPEVEGTVKQASFWLHGQEFMAMDSNREHNFTFNEAISFIVDCQDQGEVDHYWQGFTEGGEEGPCGWLKDEYGVSWQIIPTALTELLQDEDAEKAGRVMQAMLQMKKIEVKQLERAYRGE
ncbi:MAG: VOC family protein [Candidatus Promineifilaceae bacterium]|nr:VOC family protein [Candidatus Promineifilaceae bacterium]